MPQCVQCRTMFHPDFCVVVDEMTNACKCVWCKTGRKEVTVEKEDGTSYQVTQKEAAENYKRFLRDLKDVPAIRKIIMKEMNKPV